MFFLVFRTQIEKRMRRGTDERWWEGIELSPLFLHVLFLFSSFSHQIFWSFIFICFSSFCCDSYVNRILREEFNCLMTLSIHEFSLPPTLIRDDASVTKGKDKTETEKILFWNLIKISFTSCVRFNFEKRRPDVMSVASGERERDEDVPLLLSFHPSLPYLYFLSFLLKEITWKLCNKQFIKKERVHWIQ